MLASAAVTVSDVDPEPELPTCFRDRKFVEELVRGIGGVSSMGQSDPEAENPTDSPPTTGDQANISRTKPKPLVRTYVATTCCSDEFGPMVAMEAQRRNFANADHKAFVGDGGAWIWTLWLRYFPTFVAIVDFLHVLGHVFTAAKAATPAIEESWMIFQVWAEACWKGNVGEVIKQIRALCEGLGPLPEGSEDDLPDDDPRKILSQELGYLEHNEQRMDYPRYRREGLPWTSSHVESTVKLFNRRVKGSEKFWGETGAEAILQLRAAFLSEDDRLERHLKAETHSPFRNYKARENRQAA